MGLMDIQFSISDQVREMFPQVHIGIITARNIDNSGSDTAIDELKRNAESELRQKMSLDTLLQHPSIVSWRNAYRAFGTKPNEFRPTAESLLRRVLRGNEIPTISTVVDLYLAIEAMFYLPIGGYDLDKIEGDIRLTLSDGQEAFSPIGASAEEEMTYAGEVVYRDDHRVLTRRWNFRDCEPTKIVAESTNIALFCEAADLSIPKASVLQCIEQLSSYIQRFCGGEISTQLIGADSIWSATL